MRRVLLGALLPASLCVAPSATAQSGSTAFPAAQSDPRLRTIPYTPGAVFTVRVAPGYVATVILNEDERIESVAVGNSAGWDVTPSKSGDHLFIKPLANGVPTNVEVVTDSRHYSFLLQSTVEGDPDAAFRIRFDYASDAPAPQPALAAASPSNAPFGGMPPVAAATVMTPQAVYRLSGDRLARPISVTDDGTRTLFVFADAATLPAIYAVDDQNHEMLVTTRRTNDGWIVDRVWRRYVLRAGKATANARRRALPVAR